MDFETKDDLIIANVYEETHGAEDVKSGTDVFEETRGAKYVEIGTDVYEAEETHGAMDMEIGTVTGRGLKTEGNLGGRNGSPVWRCIDGPLVVSVTYIFTRINKYESFKLFLQVHYVAKKEFS